MRFARTCRGVVVGAALVVSACSGHHSGDGKAASGVVAGRYQLVGGPAPGLARPQQGTIWAFAGKLNLSKLEHTTAVVHVRTDRSGNFKLSLTPGEYTLIGALGLSGSVHSRGCGVPTFVHVKASVHTAADLVCSVP